jgi:Flp pilus assembly protein TadD
MALAELEARAGNIDGALKLAAGLSDKQPKSAAGPMLAGDAYMRAKDYDKATAHYTEAMKRENTGVLALRMFNAGRAAGRTTEALADLQKWVDGNGDIAVRHVLATNYIALGYQDEAVREGEKLMKVDGDNPVLLNNMAWLYDQKGDKRAVDLAKKALEKAPNSPEIMDTLGWLLTRRGDLERGLELLRKAHNTAPKQGDIAYHLAVALDKTGKTVEARRTLERILNARIDFSEAQNARDLLKKLGG